MTGREQARGTNQISKWPCQMLHHTQPEHRVIQVGDSVHTMVATTRALELPAAVTAGYLQVSLSSRAGLHMCAPNAEAAASSGS